MSLRACTVCGVRIPVGSTRCSAHSLPDRTGRAWRRMAAKMKQAQAFCSYCGRPGTPANPLQVDHIVPLHAGGTNRPDNAQVLCRRCNREKA